MMVKGAGVVDSMHHANTLFLITRNARHPCKILANSKDTVCTIPYDTCSLCQVTSRTTTNRAMGLTTVHTKAAAPVKTAHSQSPPFSNRLLVVSKGKHKGSFRAEIGMNRGFCESEPGHMRHERCIARPGSGWKTRHCRDSSCVDAVGRDRSRMCDQRMTRFLVRRVTISGTHMHALFSKTDVPTVLVLYMY